MATGGGVGKGTSGGNTHYNQAYMMHHHQQQQPPVMPTSTHPVRPVGQQQAQELLRKQRKCVSCGNTALAKCDFRSCGTCCSKAKNQCLVHGQGQGSKQVGTAETPAPQYPWPAVPGMGMMPPYMRPPYLNPSIMSMGGYRLPYGSPGLRMQSPPIQTEAQKEAQLEKARKAFVAAQKEALMVNSWRVLKLKAYADAELASEDEAFDRYMQGVNWLEMLMMAPEGFQMESWVDQKDDSRLLDVARAKLEGDSKKKELQKQKLQRAVTKNFQKFRRGDTDMENMVEIHEFNQAGFGRRDNKRMKVQTADGKEYLKRINAWEDLFQGTSSISNMADVSLFLDTYKETLGHDLGHALPHLIKRDTTFIKKDAHESTRSRITEHEKHKSACPVPEVIAVRENQKERDDIERKINAEADGVLQAEKQEAECPTAASEQGADGEILVSEQGTHDPMEIEKQEAQAEISAAKQETDDQAEAEGPTSASEQRADDQISALELEKQEAHGEISAALETDKLDGHASAMEIEKQEEAHGETAAVEPDQLGADDSKKHSRTVNKDDAQVQEDGNAVEAEAAKDMKTAVEEEKQEAGTEKQEKDGISSKDLEACAGEQVVVGTSDTQDVEEDWIQDLPRVPVRRLVMSLIKTQKSLVDDGRDRFMKRFGCCRVDLDEQSSKRVYDNQHRYSFEAL